MGEALNTVEAAYRAISDGDFDRLAPLIAADIDWYGIPRRRRLRRRTPS